MNVNSDLLPLALNFANSGGQLAGNASIPCIEIGLEGLTDLPPLYDG